MRISLHIATKDRHSEVSLLLQSLRTQSYQEFDVLILDDASGTPLPNCGFFMNLVQRMKLEGHKMKILRNDFSRGVCSARNKLIESDKYGNPLVCRLDDDAILEQDYLERLKKVIESGYDMASGVIPLMVAPDHIRDSNVLGDVINEHKLDKEGKLIQNKDECGNCYTDDVILKTHQFRTNALYKRSITDSGVRYPDNLTPVGFREEGFFSFATKIKGFKIGVDTGAVAYHMHTPSGGVRRQDYAQCTKLDQETFEKWIKKQYGKHGNFLEAKQ